MSSFIAAAPPDTAQEIIRNDGFFPDLDVAHALKAMRLDGTVTPERLRAALVEAALSTNEELANWKARQYAAGHTTLREIPTPEIDGQSAHLHRYQRAVYCMARASRIERYPDFDATAAGDRKGEVLLLAVDDLRRDARWAISDMLGIPRSTVALI
ncbi:head completion/stabilization protein [Cupriavidus basilensis]|uniref:Phage head completion-stabilization protein n=1 Tax=Cupriavidus basilensis TaxID=68895 RepID=A0A0C4Y213_9BURK|nr:head completion/stabilization protein [Cupriavidus basilensis]AJG19132.1 Phage head completion-stabilization protein [Cupriavidus basilensis]